MSKRQQRNHNESVPTEGESLPLSSQAEEDPELELTPPIVTRTRSGRRIRTPAALLDAQISSPAKTPGRRTRKSTIQEEPEHNAGSGALNEPSVERTTSKPIGESSVDVGLSYELEPEIKKSKVDAEDSAEVIRVTEPTVTEPTGCTKSNQENNNSLIPEIRPGTDGVSEKENQACSGQKSVSDIIKRNRISESVVNPKRTIPLGKPKSGRVWKDRNKQRFSALLRDKPLRSSWEKKMEAKREKELVKKYAQQLKDEKAREREEKRKRREENLKRREENERKAEIVQVIRNTVKLKRMKKKQLRRIEKRDTHALLQKPQPRNQSAARKGSKGDN